MKIALMFAGQPRFLERGYSYFKSHILPDSSKMTREHDVDVYMHMWHTPSTIGKAYDAAPWNDGRMEIAKDNVPELFTRLYNPVSLVIQPQKRFEITTDFSSRTARTPWQIIYSMNYSRRQVSRLRQLQEIVNNTKYDWCIITRTDWAILEPFNIADYDPNCINLHNDVSNPKVEAYNDGFIFSSPENIDRVLTMYDYLSDHWQNNPDINFAQEDLLAVHLRYIGIPICTHPIKYGIIRAEGMDLGNIR